MLVIDIYQQQNGKEGTEMYSKMCEWYLRKYLDATPEERAGIRETEEFKEAVECVKSFHSSLMRKVIFGLYKEQDLLAAILNSGI